MIPGLIGQAEFPGGVESVADARAFARRVLGAGYKAIADDVVLLISELMTNAVRHSDSGRCADGVVTLILAGVGENVLRIEVGDAGSASELRVRLDVDQDSESGRGLFLVDLLADKWGWHAHDEGRVVWFEVGGDSGVALNRHPGEAPQPPAGECSRPRHP